MGLILLTWVFCHHLVKIHFVVIEILSFSCSVLLLVKADGDHLAVPNCQKKKKKKKRKKSKWLYSKIIVTQSWYNSIERFSQFLYFVQIHFHVCTIFSKGCHLEKSILI